MKDKLKVGIAGFSMIGPVHYRRIYDKSRDIAEIVAIADHNTELLNSNLEKVLSEIESIDTEFDKRSEISRLNFYDDYRNMLSRSDIDVIHLCLPHNLHTMAIVDSIKKNKFVIVEKPLGLNLSDVSLTEDRLSSLEIRKIALISQNRYNEEIDWLQRQMMENDFKIRNIEITIDWHRPQSYYDQNGGWRGRNTSAFGGVLTNQAYHSLDLALWLLKYKGQNIKVVDKENSIDKKLHPEIDVFDTVKGTLVVNNSKIDYYATTCNPKKEDATKLKFWLNGGYVQFITTEEGVRGHSDFLGVPEFTRDQKLYKTSLGRPSYGFGHASNIRYAYESFLSGYTPAISFHDGKLVLKVCEEILKP